MAEGSTGIDNLEQALRQAQLEQLENEKIKRELPRPWLHP